MNAVSVSDDILKYLKKSYEIPEEEKSLKNVKKSSTSALENVIFCSSGSHCAADANDLFEHFQSDENSSSILFNILIISQYIVCYEKMKSEKRKTLCPFYMKLFLEVFSKTNSAAEEGSIFILAVQSQGCFSRQRLAKKSKITVVCEKEEIAACANVLLLFLHLHLF